MKLHFNIIEDSTPVYLKKFDEFVELYNNPNIRVEEIRERLDWNNKHYIRARKHALNEGLIKPRKINNPKKKKKTPRKPQYYTKDPVTGTYKVIKRVDGKITYFGSFTTKQGAEKRVEELKKNNWRK